MDNFVIKSFHLLTLRHCLTHNANWTSVQHIEPEKIMKGLKEKTHILEKKKFSTIFSKLISQLKY